MMRGGSWKIISSKDSFNIKFKPELMKITSQRLNVSEVRIIKREHACRCIGTLWAKKAV